MQEQFPVPRCVANIHIHLPAGKRNERTGEGMLLQGQSHRKPGYPMRAIDEAQLEAWDEQNTEKFAVQSDVTSTTLSPKRADAERIGTKKQTPIE